MFNVFLPKLLETRSESEDPSAAPKGLADSLWDVVIYALGGCPGAIVRIYPSALSGPLQSLVTDRAAMNTNSWVLI